MLNNNYEKQANDADKPAEACPMEFKQHPLSAAFPAMKEDEYESLCDSIQEIGVQNPITLFEGMVIDGWHRYRAATDAGMACPSKALGDVDPQDFVIAQNKARRHISQGQFAMVTAAVYDWRPHGDQRSTLNVDRPKTTAELADIAGVHVNTITQAKAVQSKGAPEVQEAVKRGEVGLPKAAAIAKLPLDEQAAALHKPAHKPAKKQAFAAPDENDADALAESRETIIDLSNEIDELKAHIAVGNMDATREEKAQAATIIAELRAEIKTFSAELNAMRISRDALQDENHQLRKQCEMQRRQLDKGAA
jgi:hypothetical protein